MAGRGAAILLGLALLGTAGLGSAAAAIAYPGSIAATGDSITRAYNTGFIPYTDNPSASWSTGTNSAVDSQYLRLLAVHPAILGRNFNDAKSGARMTDLAGQMQVAASQRAAYVTVEMGGNDVCTSSESTMTSVASFRAQFSAAMNTITAASRKALVSVSSIPNVYGLWSIFKDNGTARFVWSLFGVCQSMLANADSTAQADVDRRARVLQREKDFNDVLESVCALYAQCRYDKGAVFNTVFTTADVTSRDYFHPSTAGQAKLAAVSWAAGYWGP